MIPLEVLVLLLVALLVLLALREAWRLTPAGTALGRAGRIGSTVVAIVAVLVVARLLVGPLPSDRALTWRVGAVLDPAEARPDTVRVEVERPSCAPGGDAWIATPVVTYTPVAVFITMRMRDASIPGCTGAAGYQDGRLPLVGGYLTGTALDVVLTQPLGGRGLFDGSGLVPEPRLPLR